MITAHMPAAVLKGTHKSVMGVNKISNTAKYARYPRISCREISSFNFRTRNTSLPAAKNIIV